MVATVAINDVLDAHVRLDITPGDVVWNFLPLPIKWMRPLSSQLPGGITAIASF
jgi:hypothetical protein